jgi:predicted lipoprotein with Yx(FWY)xxD motif
MKRLFTLGAAIAAAVALAACGSGGGSNDSATAAPNTSGATVSTMQIGGAGRVLVDSSGQALYRSSQEMAAGKVLCTGACNSFWQPLTASGGSPKGSSVAGKLGVVSRPDGGKQVTYKGTPLYTFTQDNAGEVTGDGFQDAFGGQHFTWHVVSAGNGGSSSAGSSSTSSGGSSGSGSGGYGY